MNLTQSHMSYDEAIMLHQALVEQAQLQQAHLEEAAQVEVALSETLTLIQQIEEQILAAQGEGQGAGVGAEELAALEEAAYVQGVAAHEAELAAAQQFELASAAEVRLATAGLSDEELTYLEQLELQAQAEAEAAGVA